MKISEIERIDLHMHTTVSDGTDTPRELLTKVKKAGLDLFSVTDHDSLLACNEIIEMLSKEDPKFLTGVELSCQDEYGKYHILGYGYDANADAIQKVIALGKEYRFNKLFSRLDFLKERFGFNFSKEEMDELLKNNNPGKPHIGNLMVKCGYASSKEEAINKYINKCPSTNKYIKPNMAIEGILNSGGIPVLAHPSYGNGGQLILGNDMEKRLLHLIGMGLKGIEAYYSGFTEKLQNELLSFAQKYDLYVTAGSDYHGKNKIVELEDTNLLGVSQGVEGIRRFLEAVHEV